MRSTPFVAAALVCAGLGLASIGAAQTVSGPTIHNVTLHEGTGVLTITGIGLGRDPAVTVDGQPVTVLPGGTDTQVAVVAPAALLTTPGTYRLTVVDPVRQVGDSFVVASPATPGAGGTAGLGEPSNGLPATSALRPVRSGAGVTGGAVQGSATTVVSPALVEVNCKVAVGLFALNFNTTGCGNTAIGNAVLYYNTTGSSNTGTGSDALYANTTGDYNAATGTFALASNTTGSENTASGAYALYHNITGTLNTASGSHSLFFNTTGDHNTAMGGNALFSNTTGYSNTATGSLALYGNTTGYGNTATGVQSLSANTTGFLNTASGWNALFGNTTGVNNTASGYGSLFTNTTGSDNTSTGVFALWYNTIGVVNTASGSYALNANTTGSGNTANGQGALSANTTGQGNTALGYRAGYNATTGGYNLFLGALVTGTAADTNTIRIGIPYSGGIGQNQTFIAGIRGTAVSGGLPVVVDGAGKLGTVGGNGSLNVIDPTNTQPSQLRLGFINGVADYGIGRNPSDGVLDFTATQSTFSGFRFNTPNAGTALAIANNGVVSVMDATNSRPYQLRLGFLNGSYDYGIGRNPSDGYLTFAATQGTYSGYRFNTPNAGTAVTIANDGAVGIGVTAPSQPLQLASGAYVSAGGVWTNASSRTLKDHVAPLSTAEAVQAVADLSPVTFVYKAAPGEARIGFIAEDVPALVATPDRRSLATMDLLAVVTKVVQVQQQQLHEQEAINADQQAVIADLRARLGRLEALLSRAR